MQSDKKNSDELENLTFWLVPIKCITWLLYLDIICVN